MAVLLERLENQIDSNPMEPMGIAPNLALCRI